MRLNAPSAQAGWQPRAPVTGGISSGRPLRPGGPDGERKANQLGSVSWSGPWRMPSESSRDPGRAPVPSGEPEDRAGNAAPACTTLRKEWLPVRRVGPGGGLAAHSFRDPRCTPRAGSPFLQTYVLDTCTPKRQRSGSDRPAKDNKPAQAAGFFCVFFAGVFGLCGAGGVVSIRRNTSSSVGGFGDFGLLTWGLVEWAQDRPSVTLSESTDGSVGSSGN